MSLALNDYSFVSNPSGGQASLRRLGVIPDIVLLQLFQFPAEGSRLFDCAYKLKGRISSMCFKSQRSAAVSSTVARYQSRRWGILVSNPSGGQPSLRHAKKQLVAQKAREFQIPAEGSRLFDMATTTHHVENHATVSNPSGGQPSLRLERLKKQGYTEAEFQIPAEGSRLFD